MEQPISFSRRRIRAFRKLKGFTQERLAKSLHVSISVIGGIERGTKHPSDELLMEISKVLNISRHDLSKQEQQQEGGITNDKL